MATSQSLWGGNNGRHRGPYSDDRLSCCVDPNDKPERRGVMRIILVLVTIFLMGCQKHNTVSPTISCEGKPLASEWFTISTSGYLLEIDFSTFTIGNKHTVQMTIDKAICEMEITAQGVDCQGSYIVESSSYIWGGSGDPGCALLNGKGTFEKTEKILIMCDHIGCEEYK